MSAYVFVAEPNPGPCIPEEAEHKHLEASAVDAATQTLVMNANHLDITNGLVAISQTLCRCLSNWPFSTDENIEIALDDAAATLAASLLTPSKQQLATAFSILKARRDLIVAEVHKLKSQADCDGAARKARRRGSQDKPKIFL